MSEEQVTVGSPEREIYVKPLVTLDKIDVKKDENENELFTRRAKLYRYVLDEEDGGVWKERGVGEIKILKHKTNGSCRILMRRDKTLKLCANHILHSNMTIRPLESSDRAMVWSTPSDFADEESKAETLCVRFGKPESATEFKEKFEESVKESKSVIKTNGEKEGEDEGLVNNLSTLKVTEEKDNNNTNKEKDNNSKAENDSKAEEEEKKT